MKSKSVFVCKQCGNETPRWQGQCPACGAWNSIVEFEDKSACREGGRPAGIARAVPKKLKEVTGSRRSASPPVCRSLTAFWAAAACAGR
ncbi:MAG: hypothetical protein ACLU3I_18975 [Acutalibacteraceae bacterium]